MNHFKSTISIIKSAAKTQYNEETADFETVPWYKDNEDEYEKIRHHNSDPEEDAAIENLHTEFAPDKSHGMHVETHPEFFASEEDANNYIINIAEGVRAEEAEEDAKAYGLRPLTKEEWYKGNMEWINAMVPTKIGTQGWLIKTPEKDDNEFMDAHGKHWAINENESKDYDFMLQQGDETPDFDSLDVSAASKIFCKLAANSHYNQITDLNHAAKSLSNVGKADDTIKQYVGSINNSANRLLFNADNFGLTPQTSAKYHNAIQSSLDELKSYVESNGNDAYFAPVSSLQSALNSYIPESISAQNPRALPAAYGPDAPRTSIPDKSNPFIPARSPGPGYSAPEAHIVNLPDQLIMKEQEIFPGKPGPETVPGPNGERVAVVPQVQEEGMAHETFRMPPAGIPGAPRPQAKLPLSQHDQEKANWELPQDANDAEDINDANSIERRSNIRMGFENWMMAVVNNMPIENREEKFREISYKEWYDWFQAGASPETAAKLAADEALDENHDTIYEQLAQAARLDKLRKIARL